MPRRTNDMPKLIITELSDEQEAMLPIYREKWRSIQISTESIKQEKVAAVIKAAYAVSDYPEPEILFYSSPMIAIEKTLTIENFKAYLGRKIHSKFRKRVVDHVQHGITQQLDKHLSDCGTKFNTLNFRTTQLIVIHKFHTFRTQKDVLNIN